MKSLGVAILTMMAIMFSSPSSVRGQNPVENADHVSYISTSQHVIETWATDEAGTLSSFIDATVASGATVLASTTSSMTSFGYGTNILVYYQGTDGDIYEIRYDTRLGWNVFNLTSLSGGPAAATGTTLTSILNGEHGYIFYIGSNSHVYELTWNSSNQWVTTDLTTTTGAPNAGSVVSLTSFLFGGDLEVMYLTSTGVVQQMYLNSGSSWKTYAASTAAGAPPCPLGNVLTGFKSPDGNAHVFYTASTGYVQELYSTSGTWRTDVVGGGTVVTSASFDGYVHAFVSEPGSTITEYYIQSQTGGTWSDDAMADIGSPSTKSIFQAYTNGKYAFRVWYNSGYVIAGEWVVPNCTFAGGPYWCWESTQAASGPAPVSNALTATYW
jgi:hypothetical protein